MSGYCRVLICLLACLPLRLPAYLCACLSGCLSFCLAACLAVCLSVSVIVRLSIYLFVHLSVCPYICPSFPLSVHLSVCPYVVPLCVLIANSGFSTVTVDTRVKSVNWKRVERCGHLDRPFYEKRRINLLWNTTEFFTCRIISSSMTRGTVVGTYFASKNNHHGLSTCEIPPYPRIQCWKSNSTCLEISSPRWK